MSNVLLAKGILYHMEHTGLTISAKSVQEFGAIGHGKAYELINLLLDGGLIEKAPRHRYRLPQLDDDQMIYRHCQACQGTGQIEIGACSICWGARFLSMDITLRRLNKILDEHAAKERAE